MPENHSDKFSGILANQQSDIRNRIFGFLCVFVVGMAFGPLGFYPAGESHALILLFPIALTSLLFGKWKGCIVGAVAGVAEMVHATFQPYDYYEKYFSFPVNSIVLFALFGLLMGVLFALACRLPQVNAASESGSPSRGIGRALAFVGVSLVGSLFASALLYAGISYWNSIHSMVLPADLEVQVTGLRAFVGEVLIDALLIAVFSIIVDHFVAHMGQIERKKRLRTTFQFWYGIIMIVLFLVCSGIGYAIATYGSYNNMNAALSDQLESLSVELSERDGIVNTLDERGVLSHDELKAFSAQAYSNINCDLPGWSHDTIALAMDGVVFASNDETLVGSQINDMIESGLMGAPYESAFEADGIIEYYQGPGSSISYLLAIEHDYDRLGETGNYELVAIARASETYMFRPLYMYVIAGVFTLVLGAVFVLSIRLLDRVVVKPIDSANEALVRITEGDLNQRVPDEASVEFSALSKGINATVIALEDSIAEASARIDRELATARAIQESALPKAEPPFPGIDSFDMYATMNPAREVGGDFYDFFELDDDRIGFVVADVSGKGIPAALFMMAAKTAIRGAMEADKDLAAAISTANRSLCEGNEAEMFVTVFAAVLEHKTGKLSYVNAGHNKPLLMHDGTWTWVTELSGPFLGSFDWADYESFELQLTPGDEFFAYTDGVNEAYNAETELFGNDRLEAFLADHTGLHPRRLLRAMRAELTGWAVNAEQSDDITMLALKYGIPPEHGATLDTKASLDNFELVEGFVRRYLKDAGCPTKTANQILIAVEELVVNVCSYAYPDAPAGEPGPLRIHITLKTQPNAAIIEIGDDGAPFDPLAQDDPEQAETLEDAKIGGLGLFMTKELMDKVEYLREGISNVTIITKTWE